MGTKVMTTRDYGLFQLHEVNREIGEGTLKYSQLENSLLEHGWWETEPMIVYPKNGSGLYTIVKGHHKFNIARKHGLPIKFQIDDNRIPIGVRENAGGRPLWSLADWVESYRKAGTNPNYKILDDFQKKTGIPLSACIHLFTIGQTNTTTLKELRDGEFKGGDQSLAKTVGDLILYCSDLRVPFSKKSAFVRALSQIVRSKVVDVDVLKKRIRQNIHLMMKKNYTEDYLAILSQVYNFRSHPKLDLDIAVRNALTEERRKSTLALSPNNRHKNVAP